MIHKLSPDEIDMVLSYINKPLSTAISLSITNKKLHNKTPYITQLENNVTIVYNADNINNKYIFSSLITKALIKDISLLSYIYDYKHINTLILKNTNITDTLMRHKLSHINHLDVSDCNYITDKAFSGLKNIQTLNISDCQFIQGKCFKHLPHLTELTMSGCGFVKSENFKYLSLLTYIDMSYCNQLNGSKIFKHLYNVEYCNIDGCIQPSFYSGLLTHMPRLKSLSMQYCNNINQDIFRIKNDLEYVNISHCKFITNIILVYLSNAKYIHMNYCNKDAIDKYYLKYIINVKELSIMGDYDVPLSVCKMLDKKINKFRCSRLHEKRNGIISRIKNALGSIL